MRMAKISINIASAFKFELLALVKAISVIIQAYYMGRIVDSTHQPSSVVLNLLLIIAATMVVEILSNIALNYSLNKYLNQRRSAMNELLAKKLLKARYSDLESFDKGKIIGIFTNDIERTLDYCRIALTFSGTVIKVSLPLIFLFMSNVVVSICILLASALSLLPGMIIGNYQYSISSQLNRRTDELNNRFMKVIRLVKLIKSFMVEDYFAKKNKSYIKQYQVSRDSLNRNIVIYSVLNRIFGILPYLSLYLVGAIFVIAERISIGVIISAAFFIGILSEGLGELQNLFHVRQIYKASNDRVASILDLSEDDKKRIKQYSRDAAITFHNVDFGYKDGTYILEKLNLTIAEKSKVLILGESGSGKSTIFRLIEGLHEPVNGNIELGTALPDEAGAPVRISAADQETILFHKTVKENICMVNKDMTEEKFKRICEVSCIDDSMLYSEGKDKIVSNLDQNLSKGQLQRINLARALAKDADIYLFDEPTEGLSVRMEEEIIHNILEYLHDKTVIMILHNPDYKDLFDRVIEMDSLKIQDQDSITDYQIAY